MASEMRNGMIIIVNCPLYIVNCQVGADGGEGPPVPIPNTEVKLVCVDNTWWVTAREDR